MNRSGFAMALVLIVLLNGCGSGRSAIKPSTRSAWKAHLTEQRKSKDHEFATDPMSPMAAVDWFALKGSGPHGLQATDSTVTQVPADRSDRLLEQDKTGAWYMVMPGDTEQELSPGQPVTFNERFTIVGYTVDGGIQVRVLDRDRPELKSFSALHYYEPDPAYAVQARVERLSEPVSVKMLTSRNLEKTYIRVARLHFQLEGRDQALSAYKMSLDGPYSDMYFVPFRDTTSGSETYGAGRFLELNEPEGDTMVLDFNLAFNPLCNYSPAYNCPLPPAENTLLIPIKAGEKTYPINH